MKQRDKRGRYQRVYRTASRWEVLMFYSVLGGALCIIVFDMIHKPHVFEVHTAEAAPVAQEVMIEVQYDWTPERIEQEIRSTFSKEPNTAVAVGKSESGHKLNPNAYNPEWHYDKQGNPICQGSYGVMQIACVHHIENPEALFDVKFNLEKAEEIYQKRGWKPWGGYTNGSYKKHL